MGRPKGSRNRFPTHRAVRPPAERFWEKVDRRGPDECWPWKASTSYGYGMFNINTRAIPASRAVFLVSGITLTSADYVCHTCDNRICCNPAHLYVGTAASNTRDMMVRGRHSRGNRAH